MKLKKDHFNIQNDAENVSHHYIIFFKKSNIRNRIMWKRHYSIKTTKFCLFLAKNVKLSDTFIMSFSYRNKEN